MYPDFVSKIITELCNENIFNEENELVILTQASSGEFENIHDRVPIIMNQEEMINYIHSKKDIFEKKKLIINKVDEDMKLF